MIEIRWRYPAICCLLMLAALWQDSLFLVRLGLAAAVFHECGHLLAYYFLWGRLPTLTISPTGLSIHAQWEMFRPGELLLLAAAGPCVNLLLWCLTLLAMEIKSSYLGYSFSSVNLALGLWSLLPIGSMDGKRICQAVRLMREHKE